MEITTVNTFNSTAVNSNTAQMNSNVFIIINKIPYAYAHYYLDNGKKYTIIEKNDCAENELPEYREQTKVLPSLYYFKHLKRRLTKQDKKNCKRAFSLYLKYVPDIVCIDCDSENVADPDELGKVLGVPTINNSMCWTRGNSKGFHIYVKIPGFSKDMEGTKVFGPEMPDVDIIKYTKNIWENEDKDFYNGDQITTFDINSIKHLYVNNRKRKLDNSINEIEESVKIDNSIQSKTKNHSELQDKIFTQELINYMLSEKIFDLLPSDYNNWIKYGMILVNANVDNIEDIWLDICKQIPDPSQSSDEERLNKLEQIQNAPKCKNPITFRSLMTELKKVLHPEKYNELKDIVFAVYQAKCEELWYQITKEEFEKTHFEFGGRIMQINEDHTLNQLNHQDAKTTYAHLHQNYGTFKVFFIDRWHEDKNKRVIKKIIMRPDLPKELDQKLYPNTYNTFQGYLIEQHSDIRLTLDEEVVDFWKDKSYIYWVIWHQLCDEKQEVYDEVVQTLANLLFAPQDIGRYHSCLTFYSNTEGVGKSLLTNLLINKIIGPNYALKTCKMDEIFGKYTELTENKILIVIEEGKRSEGAQFVDVAKDWLTSETTIVHKKCQNKYITNNCCHLICNTNNKSVWTVSESNRRYLISHCKEEKLREDYLEGVIEEFNNKDKIVAFCRYLYTIWNPKWQCETFIQGRFKETDIYKEQVQDQIGQIDMFYKQMLIDDQMLPTYRLDKEIKPLELYNVFRAIIHQCGIQDKDIWSNRRFGEHLKKTPGVTQNGYKNYTLSWTRIEEYLREKHLLE